MSKILEMRRQGDVLIIKRDAPPEGDQEVIKPDKRNRLILAEGEATGHAHAVPATEAHMYAVNAMTLLEVHKETQVVHEEHGAINLDAGLYEIRRQREFTPERNVPVAD